MPKAREPKQVFMCDCGDHAWTETTGGFVALVSPEDRHLLESYRWSALKDHNVFYATTSIRDRTMRLHRLVLPSSSKVDHANRNGLDNRRHNVRPCSHSQNRVNSRKNFKFSSRYKGVSRDSRSGLWLAGIKFQGRTFYLGRFQSEEMAAAAYDDAARRLFGDFAPLNFSNGLQP